MWIYVKAENVGKQEKYLPDSMYFYILYIDSFIKTENISGYSVSLGKEKGYYSESVMPGVSKEGWLTYEVPKDAKAGDMLIALEYDYDKYYYWEVLEIEKMTQLEAENKEEEQVKEIPLALGQVVEYEGLRTSVIKYEFAEWIKTDSEPLYQEEGAIFFWIYVKAENIGEVQEELPGPYDFYILYKETEIEYEFWNAGYSIDHQLYSHEYVYPGVSKKGWILYDLPSQAKVEDIVVKLYDSRISPNGEYIWKLGK